MLDIGQNSAIQRYKKVEKSLYTLLYMYHKQILAIHNALKDL